MTHGQNSGKSFIFGFKGQKAHPRVIRLGDVVVPNGKSARHYTLIYLDRLSSDRTVEEDRMDRIIAGASGNGGVWTPKTEGMIPVYAIEIPEDGVPQALIDVKTM